MRKSNVVLRMKPVCFWEFNHPGDQSALGKENYILHEQGTINYEPEGIFSDVSVRLEEGKFFSIPRNQCPALDFSGSRSAFTMIAWVKRSPKDPRECQAIAGMWNETESLRQYCMFLDLGIWDSDDQLGGHISDTGGPTQGWKYCMDAAIGQTQVPYGQWSMLAFSYDGKEAACFLDGKLDKRPEFNPYFYGKPLFTPKEKGADFTVGAVHRSGEMGNWYTGLLGGLAVFDRPLSADEIEELYKATLL